MTPSVLIPSLNTAAADGRSPWPSLQLLVFTRCAVAATRISAVKSYLVYRNLYAREVVSILLFL